MKSAEKPTRSSPEPICPITRAKWSLRSSTVRTSASLPAVTARLYSSDEVEYFSYLRSLYFDRDVSFDNEYRYFYDHDVARSAGFHDTFLVGETAVGRRVNYATVGASILWLPFFAAADVWTRVTGAAEANGMTQPYIVAVAYGSAVYGFLAMGTLGLPLAAALFSLAAFLFATSILEPVMLER